MAKARTIVEDNEVCKVIDAARKKHRRVEEIFEALKWRLARGPEVGVLVGGSDHAIYCIKSPWFPELPVVVLYYHWDDNEVSILRARIIPPIPSSLN